MTDDRRKNRQIKLTASTVAFLIGFVILTALLLPSLWAPAVGVIVGGAAAAGTYGMVAGRELNLQRRSAELTTEQASMRERLDSLETTIRTRRAQLPPSTHAQLRLMTGGLGEIIDRWDTLRRAPDQQDAVAQTIRMHLPRTIELFLELPDSAKPQHAEEFRSQIGLMAEAVAKTRDKVVQKDLQALKSNRWLLEEALTDPDERLFKNEGL